MKNWIEAVNECALKGEAFVLVTVLGVQGSTPRENGAKMVISAERSCGTIGGGNLEYQAMSIAAEMLSESVEQQRIAHFPLGARLGQCCGGRTALLFECFPAIDVSIMLFGAGHVGRALAAILQQLPCRLHWVDSRADQHPPAQPANVVPILSDTPAAEVTAMPANSYYLIMTHSHQLDFEILEAVLQRGDARYVGLIGSVTKWARFRHRFLHRGYDESFFRCVRCPVGLDAVPGKLPIEVAVSIAAEIIGVSHANRRGTQGGKGIAREELRRLAAEGNTSRPVSDSGEYPGKSRDPQ